MEDLIKQLFSFIVTMCIGLTMAVVFDIYRVIRGVWQPRKIGTFIGDAIFWVIITVIVYALLFWGNWGELRIYVFLGIILGIIIHVKLFSRKLVFWVRKLLIFAIKISRKFISIIMKPISLIWKIILVPVGMVFAGIAKFKKALIKRVNAIKNLLKKKQD